MKKAFASLILALLLSAYAAAGVYEDLLMNLKSGDTAGSIALLDRGVDVNTVDSAGNTLVMLAVREDNKALLEQLLLRRARVNVRNRNGDTALRLAAFGGKLSFVQRLVEAGAEVNMYGWSPLSYAAFNGHTKIVDYLLKRGAEIDAVTENGATALMIAVRNGHRELVALLLQRAANPNISNENGETALDWAEKANDAAMIQRLRDAGGKTGTPLPSGPSVGASD
jgi:ankyrin repeat protein